MQIANPIYDTFFKFLLEDTSLAKKLLSAVIEEDIISLELRPQEFTIAIPEKYLSVLRVDFKAIIRTPDGGQKKILIEMQKTRVLFDVLRFRKYLADNYKSQDEFGTGTGNVKETLPIITVYFLNFKLPNIEFPLLKISRSYIDLVTKEVLPVKDDFIEQLTHDCYAIQIPRLRLNMQNRVEKLLSIFNQKYVKTADNKILNLPPEWNDDAELKEFIERLNKPLQDENMIRRADAEDEIEAKFEDIERKLEEAQKAKVKAEQEKLQAEQEKLQAEQEKLQAEQEKLQLEKQIEAAIEKMLLSKLFTIEQIAEFQNLPIETIAKVKLKLNL